MKVHGSLIVAGLAAFLVSGAYGPAHASNEPEVEVEVPLENGLETDARQYAQDFGVTLGEAERRLRAQQYLDTVSSEWARLAGASLAGIHLEHEPTFRLVVRLIDEAPPALVSAIKDSGVSVEVLAVKQPPLTELNRIVEQTDWTRLHPGVLGAFADERTGEIVVDLHGTAVDEQVLRASVARIEGLAKLPVRVALTDIGAADANRGGRDLSSCTSAFTVQNSSGAHGMLTAGHCGNAQSYYWFSGGGPFAMTFQAEQRSAWADLQWHTTSAQPIEPLFHANSTTTARPQQGVGTGQVGQYVCRRGKTTGYDCTTVVSITYRPTYSDACPGTTCEAVFSRTEGATVAPGDSGGPWFIANTPHGVTKGYVGTASIYTRVWYLNTLGLTLLQG